MSESATSTATPAPTSTGAALSQSAPASAPAAPPASTPSASAPPSDSGSWVSGLSEETKNWVSAKGIKDPETLANSYRQLEKLHGVPADRIAKLPERFYDDKGAMTAEGRAIYEKLGAPKKAEEYGLKAPQGGDQKAIDAFMNKAHELGLTKAQAEQLNKWGDSTNGERARAMQEAAINRFNDEDKALKAEWGGAFEQEKKIAADGMRKMGWDGKIVDSMAAVIGHKETMKLLNQIGKATGESTFFGGQKQDMKLVPQSAKAKIEELKGDKSFGERLLNGDRDAKAQWDRLHADAFGL